MRWASPQPWQPGMSGRFRPSPRGADAPARSCPSRRRSSTPRSATKRAVCSCRFCRTRDVSMRFCTFYLNYRPASAKLTFPLCKDYVNIAILAFFFCLALWPTNSWGNMLTSVQVNVAWASCPRVPRASRPCMASSPLHEVLIGEDMGRMPMILMAKMAMLRAKGAST